MKKINLLAALFFAVAANAQVKKFNQPLRNLFTQKQNPGSLITLQNRKFNNVFDLKPGPYISPASHYVIDLPQDRMPCVQLALTAVGAIPNPGKGNFGTSFRSGVMFTKMK